MVAAEASEKRIGEILKFKVLIQQFLDHLLTCNSKEALKVLEKANKIVSCEFHPEPKIDLGICKAVLQAQQRSTEGFPQKLAPFIPARLAVESARIDGNLHLVFPSEWREAQMYKRLQENCKYLYAALEEIPLQEAEKALDELEKYLFDRVGIEVCAFCNSVLAFHNQIEGFLSPMIPFWIGKLVVVHSICLKKHVKE
jgi:hypothetical protein